jgi:hypothetical protein
LGEQGGGGLVVRVLVAELAPERRLEDRLAEADDTVGDAAFVAAKGNLS